MASSGLEGGDIQFGPGVFDPVASVMLRLQIVVNFQLSDACSIEEMQGFRGGLNEGVWFLKDPSRLEQELVLKLVRCKRIASNVLTEAENCIKVLREHPGIASDNTLAFPSKVFGCIDQNGEKKHDLIVMRKVRGERMAELICRKWYGKQFQQLYQMLEKVGVALADFHGRYGNIQHGDFQPSNLFYDEVSDSVSIIDIGGMGVPCLDNDIEHFQKALRLLSESYGNDLQTIGFRHFEQGYKRQPHRR